ncbi:hypothetical protein [Streptomyces chartreusis]|uniref:hypothetical protein n=1 Tax=Streptomyces chartreusis TaxID=1969 RepID=UPI0033BC4ACF
MRAASSREGTAHGSADDVNSSAEQYDEAVLTARIEAGNASLREAGFDAVPCLIGT